MNKEVDPPLYKNEHQARLRGLIENEIAGQEIVQAQSEGSDKLINIMEVLHALLKQVRLLIETHSKIEKPSFAPPKGNENATWIVPDLVCTVKYMMKSEAGSMRQPVFKGLREDKVAGECICE